MRIPKETIDLIRERCRIEEVVQRYVPSLKKKGNRYWGLCPFHREKTPSFSVNPDMQIFYCFGCHTGGNVFTFIEKIERVEFPENVKIAADMVGIEIKEENAPGADRFAEMSRINDYAMRLYHKFLLSGEGAAGLEYLKGRGLTDRTIEEFNLGFAPDSWNFLTGKLRQKRASMELAEECSLVGKKDEHYYDRFRKRVMFPIKDPNGRVIAFGGRVINDELPKYINSQETPIFKKRNVLYGMDKARRHFADMGRAIIVEGYLDVIGCHQAGIQNVVAPLGTALTEQQVRAIARYCEEIVMLFDADSAGINAAIKSLDVVKDINVSIKIATLTDGDPFDCVIKRGAREFMAVVDKAQSPVDFRIERVMTLKRKNGPVKTLLLLFEVLRDIDLESNRSIYLKKISTMVGIDENAVRRDFVRFLEKGSAPQSVHDENDPQGQTDFITRGYRSLVALCCNHPALIGKAVMDFSISQIEDSASRNILGKMTDLYNENDSFQMNKLFDFFTNGIELDILNRSLNGDCRVEDPDAAYEEIYLNMKLHEIDCRIDKYADLIRKTPESRHEYLTEIEILRREKEKLSQYIYNRGRRV